MASSNSFIGWFFYVIVILILISLVIYLSMIVTEIYIKNQIKKKIMDPFLFFRNHTTEINEALCPPESSKFLPFPSVNTIMIDNNCYDEKTALFLSILCENVSTMNCFKDSFREKFVVPDGFRNDYDILMMPGQDNIYGVLFFSEKWKTTFLIWSGTVTLGMWKQDFKAFPMSISQDQPEVRVHEGFLEIYKSVKEKIKHLYDTKYKGILGSEAFVISGHSLGGGVSPISAYDLVSSGTVADPTSVITFGSPRSGNNDFAMEYKKLSLKSLRIFNTEDIVPMLPFPSVPVGFLFNGTSENKNLQYTHVDDGVSFTVNLGNWIKNHINAYVTHLPDDSSLISVCPRE